jgi:hypothetical protein
MRLARIVIAAAAAIAAATCGLLALALDAQPRVPPPRDVAPDDVARALQLLARHDPRRQRPGVVRVLRLQQRDLELLIQHALGRVANGAVRVEIGPDTAAVRSSTKLAWGPFSRWLNLDVGLAQGAPLPKVERLAIGSLPLPSALAEPLARALVARRVPGLEPSALTDVVRGVDFRPRQLIVFYAWHEDTTQRMLSALVSVDYQQRLRVYNDTLARLAAQHTHSAEMPLPQLMSALFEVAWQRSAAGEDAAQENRAAIVALAFFANHRGLAAIVPSARAWPRPSPRIVTLAGRVDLPLHLLISAAIAVEAGTPLADAVGLYKEISDSRIGSGFSFNDLAADRAGTRLGEAAMRQPQRLQRLLAGRLGDADLLPDLSDLPEFLGAEEFQRRFGGVGAPEFKRTLTEIDSRLDRMPLLR